MAVSDTIYNFIETDFCRNLIKGSIHAQKQKLVFKNCFKQMYLLKRFFITLITWKLEENK